MKNFKLLIFSLILLTFSSCKVTKIIKGLYSLNTKKISLTEKHFGDKTILFIGIHHAGRNVYYQNLSDTIAYYKENDFIVYYEKVKSKETNYDSLESDIIERKVRKMIGVLPNKAFYSYFDSLVNFTMQPPYDSLNIDSSDINADVSLKELIFEYEKVNSEITLTEIDTIAFDAYYCEKAMKGVDKIIIDFRNKHIAKTVYLSEHKNIIVLFGVAHRKGFFKELASLYSKNKKN